MARVLLPPEAVEDLVELDRGSRKQAFKAIKKLQQEPEKRGAPLGSELTTFRKLVVGNRQFRIVYRVESDGTVVVVWVIASRVDSECYDLAMGRLELYGERDVAERLQHVVADIFGKERP